MNNKVEFFDFHLDLFDVKEVNSLVKLINQPTHIISMNMEQFVLYFEDQNFANIVQNAEIIIPDGAAITFIYKLFYGKSIKKLAGIDLAKYLLENKKRVAVLGSNQSVIDQIKQKYGEKIVFSQHGFYDLEKNFSIESEKKLVEKIISSKPEVLLVGMGAPRQEKFIYRYKNDFKKIISMGVGGSLDVFAGELLRAPQWMIKMNLEWLFRIFQEPFRLNRFLCNVIKLILLLIKVCRKKS